MTDPRLFLLDFTSIRGPAATSTLKAAYFEDWREDALLHVLDMGQGYLAAAAGVGDPRILPRDGDVAAQLVEAFRPQVMLYRPVADSAAFHDCAMASIRAGLEGGAGLAIWMMDDWPARLETDDPARFAEMDRDLRFLFSKSSLNFAISGGMAKAFAARYGAAFDVAHNGVAPADWPPREKPLRKDVIIRYAGSLAPDTTRDSVSAAASAVARLAQKGVALRMEGRTQPHWMEREGKALNRLKNVSFAASNMEESAYRQWLCEADILLVAYNFDAATRAYLRYSFANKLPETMASGAAILGIGPSDLETLGVLGESNAALMVSDNDPEQIEAAIEKLVSDKAMRETLGARARDYAFTQFNLPQMKTRFKDALAGIACDSAPETAGANAAIEAVAGPEVPPSAYRRIADSINRNAPFVGDALRPVAQTLRRVLKRSG